MFQVISIWRRETTRLRLAVAGVAFLTGFGACQSVNRTIVVVPQIPGADYVGSEDCSLCHEELNRGVEQTVHARLIVDDANGLGSGCESCHGPGSLHSMEGGGRHLIYNPGRSAESCLRCHIEVQGQFALPYHHPVDSGKVACVDCHDPHGPDEADFMNAGMMVESAGGCAECHAEQAGPFVFEHEALREGCTVCHDPHGSPNNKMLKVANPSLCLQCHFTEQRSNALMIGGVDHTGFGFIQQGSCWTAGCHEAVHGSHVNGSLRF